MQASRNAATNSIPALTDARREKDTAHMASENIAQRTFKFRVYPSKAQITRLQSTLSLCCELYNAGLQERRDAYRLERRSIHYIEQAIQLPEIKQARPEFNDIHSQVLQDVL